MINLSQILVFHKVPGLWIRSRIYQPLLAGNPNPSSLRPCSHLFSVVWGWEESAITVLLGPFHRTPRIKRSQSGSEHSSGRVVSHLATHKWRGRWQQWSPRSLKMPRLSAVFSSVVRPSATGWGDFQSSFSLLNQLLRISGAGSMPIAFTFI